MRSRVGGIDPAPRSHDHKDHNPFFLQASSLAHNSILHIP